MEKNCKYILWDLDGTLTDPMIGITTCVQYALRHLGIEVKDLQELCPFMVATSKPEVFARKILDHFQLAAYFSFVGGATLDGVRSTKEEVIDYVLKTNEVVSLSEVIMVGDRKFDILGAKHAGVSSVGCVYGYGSREELETAGADYVVDSIGELQNLLLP